MFLLYLIYEKLGASKNQIAFFQRVLLTLHHTLDSVEKDLFPKSPINNARSMMEVLHQAKSKKEILTFSLVSQQNTLTFYCVSFL